MGSREGSTAFSFVWQPCLWDRPTPGTLVGSKKGCRKSPAGPGSLAGAWSRCTTQGWKMLVVEKRENRGNGLGLRINRAGRRGLAKVTFTL